MNYIQDKRSIEAADGKVIYGMHDYDMSRNTDSVMIFCHGLSGSMYEYHYVRAAELAVDAEIGAVRFNFYDSHDDARCLSECDLSVHCSDLHAVVDHWRERYSTIYLVGHSMGVPVVIDAAVPWVAACVYWDPVIWYETLKEKRIGYNEKSGVYTRTKRVEYVLNEQMVADWKKTGDIADYENRLHEKSVFVFAELWGKYSAWKEYLWDCPHHLMAWATHSFVERGVIEEVMGRTVGFVLNH